MQNPEIKNMSDKIALCYWDYYNEGVEFYKKYILLHQKLGNPIIFAGGAWTWNGIAPGISKALQSSKDALTACCEMNIKDVFCTDGWTMVQKRRWLQCCPFWQYMENMDFQKNPQRTK